MGFVLLALIVGLPLLMVGIATLWDRRNRRLTGSSTTVATERFGRTGAR